MLSNCFTKILFLNLKWVKTYLNVCNDEEQLVDIIKY